MSHSWRKTDVNRGMWSAGGGAGEGQRPDDDRRGGVRSRRRSWRRSSNVERTCRRVRSNAEDAPRGREWRYTNRVAAAQGSSPRRKKAGFSTCFSLPLALPTVTTVVSNDHSGTSSLGGKSSSSSSKVASGTSSSSSAAAPRARQRSAKSARNAVEREPRRVARRAIGRARTIVCATHTRRGMLGGDVFTEVGRARWFVGRRRCLRARRAELCDCSPVVIRNPVLEVMGLNRFKFRLFRTMARAAPGP